jgi:hypothetical protein
MIKSNGFTRKHVLALAAVAGVVALSLAGCTAQGGGFIASNNGATSGKATFGFTWQTTDNGSIVLRGSWHDGDVDFRLDRGDSLSGSPYSPCVSGTGHYVSTNKSHKGSGNVNIIVCDVGDPGPTNGDSIDVDPTSGVYSSYANSGQLDGGNLTVTF